MKTLLEIVLSLFVLCYFSLSCNASVKNSGILDNELLEKVQVEANSPVQEENTEDNLPSHSNRFWHLFRDEGEEDDDNDETLDNNEEEFKFFNMVWKDKNPQEDSVTEKIFKSTIKRTDIPSFLLKDDLTFQYEKGPFSQMQFYGGYRGSLSAIFNPHNYSTSYDNSSMETGFYGKFRNPNYNFKFMLKPIPIHGENYIDQLIGDVYVVNTQIPHHQITVGYSRIQTGIEGGASSFILPFATRSQIARNFGNTRGLNVRLTGNYNYGDYSISYGSSGKYITSGMPGTEFAGQFSIKPFGSQDGKYGKLSIGAGLTAGHNRNNYAVGTFHVAYKHKKLWSTFEVGIADGYNGSKGISSNRAFGYAFTVGWKFNPHLQLIGRIDQFDPDRTIASNNKREYTIGINWFVKGQALRFILNWVFCQNQAGPDSQRIIFGTQIML